MYIVVLADQRAVSSRVREIPEGITLIPSSSESVSFEGQDTFINNPRLITVAFCDNHFDYRDSYFERGGVTMAGEGETSSVQSFGPAPPKSTAFGPGDTYLFASQQTFLKNDGLLTLQTKYNIKNGFNCIDPKGIYTDRPQPLGQ